MATRIFSKEYLLDELDLFGTEEDILISDHRITNGKYSHWFEVIFKVPDSPGIVYSAEYSMDRETPWEFQSEVEATEVHLVDVTVRKWVPK